MILETGHTTMNMDIKQNKNAMKNTEKKVPYSKLKKKQQQQHNAGIFYTIKKMTCNLFNLTIAHT